MWASEIYDYWSYVCDVAKILKLGMLFGVILLAYQEINLLAAKKNKLDQIGQHHQQLPKHHTASTPFTFLWNGRAQIIGHRS